MASIKRYSSPRAPRGYAWRVQYRGPDGRSHTKQGFATKDEAQAWADQNATTVRDGTWIDQRAQRAPVQYFADIWLTGLTRLKPSTRRVYEMAWTTHVAPTWALRPVGSIRPSEIQRWVSEQQLSGATIRRNHNIFAQILDLAVDDRAIKENPARGVKLPRKNRAKRVYLTMEEVKRLADESIHPEIVWVLATVGMRWGELAGIQAGDVNVIRSRIDLVRNVVTVGHTIEIGTLKTQLSRTVAVPRFVMRMLRPNLEGKLPSAWLFPGTDGGPMKLPDPGRGWFRGAADRAGFPGLTPHGLRHVAAGLMIQEGANPLTVARQLGHDDPSITLKTYAALWDESLDEVGAALDRRAAQAF